MSSAIWLRALKKASEMLGIRNISFATAILERLLGQYELGFSVALRYSPLSVRN